MFQKKLALPPIVTLLFFVLAISTLAANPGPKDKALSPETVFSNPTSIAINSPPFSHFAIPAQIYPSQIKVSRMTGTITRIAVTLRGVSSTGMSSQDFLLVGPGGEKFVFLSDVAFSSILDDAVFTIADDANAPFPAESALFFGSYKPTSGDPLGDSFTAPAPGPPYNQPPDATFASVYNGTNPNGTWSLYVVHDGVREANSLNSGWSLHITTTGTPSTVFTDPAFNFVGGAVTKSTPYGTQINVTGMSGALSNLKVKLNDLSHPFVRGIDMLLVSPNGKGLVLFADVGGAAGGSNANITFDDAAPEPFPAGSWFGSGTFRPADYHEEPRDTFPAPAPYRDYHIEQNNALSNFYGFSPNGLWTLYIVEDGTHISGTLAGGWSLEITTTPAPAAAAASNLFDFNGDHRTDISVWRPPTATWLDQDVSPAGGGPNFGRSTDKLVPADYDGDGKTDYAIWRAETGTWIVRNSPTQPATHFLDLGMNGDLPAPADFDGDGKSDPAVFRPSTGRWLIRQSATNAVLEVPWGMNGDLPVPHDYDNDGKDDLAVFRPSVGDWYVLRSSDSQFQAMQWGANGDKPLPGDYDSDGKADFAVFRPSNGAWYVFRTSDSGFTGMYWGLSTDIPVPGDYDGDGRLDFAVWRPSDSFFYIAKSSDAGYLFIPWGVSTDTPVAAAFVR